MAGIDYMNSDYNLKIPTIQYQQMFWVKNTP